MGAAEEPLARRRAPALAPRVKGGNPQPPKIARPGRSSVRMGLTLREGKKIARTKVTIDRVVQAGARGGCGVRDTGILTLVPMWLL